MLFEQEQDRKWRSLGQNRLKQFRLLSKSFYKLLIREK